MRFDHKQFFDGFKAEFDPTLDQGQVDGIEFLLSAFENEPAWDDVRHIAYAFATVYHETAASMQPVEEGYYLAAKHGVKFWRSWQKKLRYAPYWGRGYVQLTWESRRIPNYSKASKALGIDFVANPDLVMVPENAFRIMTLGMHEGGFTGHKLADFIHGRKADYTDARKIINGLDKAGLIAGYARRFEQILRSSAAGPKGGTGQSPTEEAGGGTPIAGDPTSPEPPPSNNQAEPPPNGDGVVVEKEENLPLWQKIKKKAAAWVAYFTGTLGGSATIEKYKADLDSWGIQIPPPVIKWFLLGSVAACLLWLLYECLAHAWLYVSGRWLTTNLVKANTTPTNIVRTACPADLAALEAAGWTVVRRG